MKKRRKNKGNRLNYKSNYSSIHHNSSSKSPISQTPSLGCLVAVKLSDRQIEAMERIVCEYERLTGESPSLAQIDRLDLVFRQALVDAQAKKSQVLEVTWLGWNHKIDYDWYNLGCPVEGQLDGLKMTALTARASKINASSGRNGGAE